MIAAVALTVGLPWFFPDSQDDPASDDTGSVRPGIEHRRTVSRRPLPAIAPR